LYVLFIQVFRKLFRILGSDEIKLVRTVCSAWKNSLELGSGLNVKIDDRLPGNIDFVRKIKVCEARVLKLNETEKSQGGQSLFLYPEALTKLVLAGPVNVVWFMTNISKFDALKKMVIRGGFLTLHDLNDGISEERQIILPSLKSLEIVINEISYPFYIPLSVRLRDPDRAAENDQRFSEMAHKVGKNISFLLDTLKCPKLRMLQVYSYQKPGFILPPAQNWRFRPLETFLQFHKDSLRELYLPDFEGKHSWDMADREHPIYLSKILVMISRYIGDREDSRQQDTNYWKNLIANQRKLKAIGLQTYDVSPEWILEAFSSLTTNSSAFLTFVEFTNQVEEQFEINCGIFAECRNLEVLRISCHEIENIISNFTKLPQSIRKVRFHSCFVHLPLVDELSKYTNLEMLEIGSLVVDEAPHHRALAVVNKLFNSRSLNYLGVTFDQSVGDSEEFRRSIESFSLYWDQRFRYTSIKINFEYELLEGWSDEVFDEMRTDRDSMTYREPEDLSSWASSTSGFEDDPRIMIFHHLPLFLGGEDLVLIPDDDDDDSDNDLDSVPSFDDYDDDDVYDDPLEFDTPLQLPEESDIIHDLGYPEEPVADGSNDLSQAVEEVVFENEDIPVLEPSADVPAPEQPPDDEEI
jgi:hypothetical protein